MSCVGLQSSIKVLLCERFALQSTQRPAHVPGLLLRNRLPVVQILLAKATRLKSDVRDGRAGARQIEVIGVSSMSSFSRVRAAASLISTAYIDAMNIGVSPPGPT